MASGGVLTHKSDDERVMRAMRAGVIANPKRAVTRSTRNVRDVVAVVLAG